MDGCSGFTGGCPLIRGVPKPIGTCSGQNFVQLMLEEFGPVTGARFDITPPRADVLDETETPARLASARPHAAERRRAVLLAPATTP